MMQDNFDGVRVVVTGGGRGIGKAIAAAFAARGARVLIGARTGKYGEEAVAGITAAGGTAAMIENDISSEAGCKALIAEARRLYGGVDIIVHAAADIPHGGIDATDEAIMRGFNSIVMAGFWLTREARADLAKAPGGGRVIFIGSISGPRTIVPGRMAYGVCKSGLETFIRGAALELAKENITVNGIEPGLIASDRPLAAMGAETLNIMGERSPVGRPGTPAEIAHATLFLASPMSGFITGHSIVMDGGSTLSTSDPSAFLVNHQK